MGPDLAVAIVALGLRLMVVEPFSIPTASMFPSLLPGDHFFIAKAPYSRFAQPTPARGDVVVFELANLEPSQPRQSYVKRVVGLPGDTVMAVDGHLVLNGSPVPSCSVGRTAMPVGLSSDVAELFVEWLGSSRYLVAVDPAAPSQTQGPFIVGPGEIWVMGDNRHNSYDSRFWNRGQGMGIPFEQARGRAFLIWLPPTRAGIAPRNELVLPPGADAALRNGLAQCLARGRKP